jgi:hypothetical protein
MRRTGQDVAHVIRTFDPRIGSPPLYLRKRRLNCLFKPNLGGECEIFLSENSRHTLLTERTLGDHPLDTRDQ